MMRCPVRLYPIFHFLANIALDTWANNSDEMVSDSDSDYNLVTSP